MPASTPSAATASPRRIVLTCNFSPWSRYSGGGQRSTHNLALALSERGHEVTVVFTKPPWEKVESPSQLPYRLRWAAYPHHRSAPGAPLRPFSNVSVACLVHAELRRHAQSAQALPMVVHANGGDESVGVATLRARHNFRFIVTPRFPTFPSYLLNPATQWARNLVNQAWLWTVDSRYALVGQACAHADRCSPPSYYGGDLLRQAFGIPEERIRPVHNGVPREFLDYHWQGHQPNQRALFFGRFAHDKGIDLLIQALAQLGEAAPPIDLVGRGPYLAEAKTLVGSLGLDHKVRFLPWADHHRLGAMLAQASMAILPSRQENFSLAVLAALAVGTPLVSTDVGGTREVLRDKENGMLCPSNDADALAQAMRHLQDNPEQAAHMGRRASQDVRQGFTWQAAAAAFEKLYV